MRQCIIVGGPKGSGKSTFTLSLVKRIENQGRTAVALEMDQWSDSYRAIRGEIADAERRKRYDLAWDWKGAVEPLIDRFLNGTDDVVFADLSGVIGVAVVHICERIAPAATGAIIVSRSLEETVHWRRLFKDDFAVPILQEFLSVQKTLPIAMPDMNRVIDPDNPWVAEFTLRLLGKK
jgi:hypothetical protein